MKKILVIISLLWLYSEGYSQAYRHPNYQAIKKEILKGWGSYNTHNLLSYSLLQEGVEIKLLFNHQTKNTGEHLYRANVNAGTTWADAKIQPIAHAPDGSYTSQILRWTDINLLIETTQDGNDILILLTPNNKIDWKNTVAVAVGILWNKQGHITKISSDEISVQTPSRSINVYGVGKHQPLYNFDVNTPYMSFDADSQVVISTSKRYDINQAKALIQSKKQAFEQKALAFGSPELAEAYKAITAAIHYNTIYEPINDRVVATVCRDWNRQRGGYVFFGWDNFFLGYLAALGDKNLAYSTIIEHLRDKTEDGFIPNNSQGNGRQSFDRSQPPVGAIMVKEVYKKYPEKWFLEAVFDELYIWNRWWLKNRLHKEMLCWGSNPAKNPFKDINRHNIAAAMLESGIDDSPMYEGIPFNAEKNVMELHDVGLNSLYIADCDALAEIAILLEKTVEAKLLQQTATTLRQKMQTLWHQESGIYVNRRTDNGEFYPRLSPTNFYPFIAKTVTSAQAKKMLTKHFYNPDEFWGDWVLPSISRNDTTFHRQAYWRGAIWAPMNFLTYLALNIGGQTQAQKALAEKSLHLFLKEWKGKGFVSENYSAIEGNSDDPRLNSERFYAWGALMAIMSFIESGALPNPKQPIIE